MEKRFRIYFLSLFLLLGPFCLAQEEGKNEPSTPDSLSMLYEKDSIQKNISADTIPKNAMDTLAANAVDTVPVPPQRSYQIASGGIDSKVDYGSEDSLRFDNADRKVHLYGQAFVRYEAMSIEANYIVVDLEKNIAIARSWPDSSGQLAGFPSFKDGEQEFDAEKMRYNFDTQKGKIYGVSSTYDDLYLHGTETKFIGGDAKDTLQSNDVAYNKSALITTCNLDEPHYGIRSSKQKVIPNKLVVVGPSLLEISGVPTPLGLPFGFFPISKGASSGLLFPRDYEYSDQWGFGLRNIGYYFPVSEYVHFSVLSDIYFNGSWGAGVTANYKKRYTYNGNIALRYSDRINEIRGKNVHDRSMSISVSHRQDAKAHPYNQFGGSINFQTNNYDQLNQNDAQSVLTNQYSSNFSFTRVFPDLPFRLSTSFRHSQNTESNQITVNFPDIDFQVQRIFPFKRQERTGTGEKWYEKINLIYSANASNRLTGSDTTFFTKETWDNAQMGVEHSANTGATFNLMKYFRVSPNVNYTETWYFKSQRRDFTFDPEVDTTYVIDDAQGDTLETNLDTVRFGTVDRFNVSEFNAFRQISTSVNMQTDIFGTIQFRDGWLRGLRHHIKPSIGFTFSPEYRDSTQFREYTNEQNEDEVYSIYENALYGRPPVQDKRMALTYSFTNIFEAKIFSRKDSATRKLKLFDNIIVSGNYNFAQDSLQFSKVSIRGRTDLLKGISFLNFNMTMDPYALNEQGKRINTFQWDVNKKFLRFENLSVSINTRLTVNKLREIFKGQPEQGASQSRENSTDAFWDLFNNFSIKHNFRLERTKLGSIDTLQVSINNLDLQGQIQLTDNWNIRIGRIGYDFISKQLTYPDLGFYRDLHCWELGMDWQPRRSTYSLYIRVKPSTLDFLKVPYRKNNVDRFEGF